MAMTPEEKSRRVETVISTAHMMCGMLTALASLEENKQHRKHIEDTTDQFHHSVDRYRSQE
jgi:hypothetical protein